MTGSASPGEIAPTISRTDRSYRCPVCAVSVPAGQLRLQVRYGRPLCSGCTGELGLAPTLEAAEAADLLGQIQIGGKFAPAIMAAIGRVRHATYQWALFRLTNRLVEGDQGAGGVS